jgi:K+-transporting ATPase ATPase B chain
MNHAILINRAALSAAIYAALLKLDPRVQWRNPVMFVVYVGSVLTTLLSVSMAVAGESFGFALSIAAWLWFTVLFANFAEAVAEGRSQAQANSLKQAKQDGSARLLDQPTWDAHQTLCTASQLQRGDYVLVVAGDMG